MTAPADPKSAIREQALALGFDAVGFAPASLGAEARAHLSDYLAGGYHGDMGWLAARAGERAEPRALWPEAKTVVVLGMNYGPVEDPLAALARRDRGAISIYARGRDYHDIVKSRLKALARFISERWGCELKVFVDTAPVMEKPLAERAGVGWQGKHTNLVSRPLGSWLFLGEIYLALELAPDPPEADHCGECRRCLDVCPTQAFPAPYRLDARRCISYLTIEHKGHIDAELRPLMGNRIYGCDDCLVVCPWNKFARATREPGFATRPGLASPELRILAALDDTAFRSLFSGSAIKRIGRDRFVRNVLIAIGNSCEPALLEAVRPLIADASPLVRAMAAWAWLRLAPAAERDRVRSTRLRSEDDPAVRAEWEPAAA
ncbi:MAG TPA: tRNA epoxyqueuosine(34) reductase QueG [Stellaceae bacterium]|nr:tRNA epoxyqueuosine(34) reductase QueG [Stellaceae bacterium]